MSEANFVLGKLYIGPVMVLGFFVFRFKSLDGVLLFFYPLSAPSNKEPLDEISIYLGQLLPLFIKLEYLSKEKKFFFAVLC